MKPKYLLLISTLSIAAVAVGAVISKGATTPIENAYGKDGTLAYSMTLDSSTNTLFQGRYGEGTASTSTKTGGSVSFASYVFNNKGNLSLESHGANTFTMKGRHNDLRTMIGSIGKDDEGFSDITSITVTFTAEISDRIGNFWAFASDKAITDVPSEGGASVRSNDPVTIPFSGSNDHHFAIVYGGDSSHSDADYWVAISSIVINYTC